MTMEEVHERLAQLMKHRMQWWWREGSPHEYAAGMMVNWARFLERDRKRNTQLIEEWPGADVIPLLNQALEAHARGEAFPPELDQSKFSDLDEPGEEKQLEDPNFYERCPRCGGVSGAREVGDDRVFGYCVRHRLKWRAWEQTLDLDDRRNPFKIQLERQADTDFLASFEEVVGEPTEEKAKAAKERKEKDYAKIVEYVRGKPIDDDPGTIGWVQATFARILVETNPEFIKPENKDKLMEALEGVLDRKQAVERAASLAIALTSEQMAAINAKRDDEDEFATMVMAAFKAFDAAGKRSGTYVVGKDEDGAVHAERIRNNWPFPP
jgi:hypothetical protein